MKLGYVIFLLSSMISNSLLATEQNVSRRGSPGTSSRAAMDNAHALAGYNQGLQGNQGGQGSFFSFAAGIPQPAVQFNLNVNSLLPSKSEAQVNAEKEKMEREINIYSEEYSKEKSRLEKEKPDLDQRQIENEANFHAKGILDTHRQTFDSTGADLAKMAAVAAIIVIPIAVIGGVGFIAYNSLLDKENELSNDLDDRIKNIHERVFQNAQILVEGYRESGVFDGMSEEERGEYIRRIFEQEGAQAERRAEDLKSRYEAARNGPCTIM